MTTSEIINPNFEEKITNALKADRTVHRVTFNPNKASPGETLFITVPKLSDEVVLVPGSLAIIFDLTVSGHANNFLVHNVSRALVNRLTVKFAGEILQNTDGYDLFKLYGDLFLTEKERANRLKGFSLKIWQRSDATLETKKPQELKKKKSSMAFMETNTEFR